MSLLTERENKIRSLTHGKDSHLEIRPVNPALMNNANEGSSVEFFVIGDGKCSMRFGIFHHDVASVATNFAESMPGKDRTHFAAR